MMAAWRMRVRVLLSSVALVAVVSVASGDTRVTIAADAWRLVESESGPTNYYTVVRDGGSSFVRSRYRPPMKTAVLGWSPPEGARDSARRLKWTWRARTLPKGGDECASGKGDSAAVVYVTWKRGLRYYTLKYVWSAVGAKGAVCDKKRNPFVAQDTIILRTGGPLDAWQSVDIDLRSEFRKHFEGGDPSAEVPNFFGVGIMSDGDQTQSESSADYGPFELLY